VTAPRLSAGALAALQKYGWPGNVRELRNFCENAVVLSRGGEITEYDLDPKFLGTAALAAGAAGEAGAALARAAVFEGGKREAAVAAGFGGGAGNRTRAAQLMGISRRTLHRKLAEWPELDVGG